MQQKHDGGVTECLKNKAYKNWTLLCYYVIMLLCLWVKSYGQDIAASFLCWQSFGNRD
jgi:hypothetical protein